MQSSMQLISPPPTQGQNKKFEQCDDENSYVMNEINNINNGNKREHNTNDNTEIIDNIKWNRPKISISIILCEKILDDCASMVNDNDKIITIDLVLTSNNKDSNNSNQSSNSLGRRNFLINSYDDMHVKTLMIPIKHLIPTKEKRSKIITSKDLSCNYLIPKMKSLNCNHNNNKMQIEKMKNTKLKFINKNPLFSIITNDDLDNNATKSDDSNSILY